MISNPREAQHLFRQKPAAQALPSWYAPGAFYQAQRIAFAMFLKTFRGTLTRYCDRDCCQVSKQLITAQLFLLPRSSSNQGAAIASPLSLELLKRSDDENGEMPLFYKNQRRGLNGKRQTKFLLRLQQPYPMHPQRFLDAFESVTSIETAVAYVQELISFLTSEEEQVESYTAVQIRQCFSVLLDKLLSHFVPQAQDQSSENIAPEDLSLLLEALITLDMVNSFLLRSEQNLDKNDESQSFSHIPSDVNLFLEQFQVLFSLWKRWQSLNLLDFSLRLALLVLGTRQQQSSVAQPGDSSSRIVQLIVQVLVLFEDADIASDPELAHLRRSAAALVVTALVDHCASPLAVLSQDILQKQPANVVSDLKAMFDVFQQMFNYREINMARAARFLECIFSVQDTEQLNQIVYTNDFKLLVEVLLRELQDNIESPRDESLQLIPGYLKAFKAIISNPAYTADWELYKYDDIMDSVKLIAKQRKESGRDKTPDDIDRLCREIDQLNI